MQQGGWRIKSNRLGIFEGYKNYEVIKWRKVVLWEQGEKNVERYNVSEEVRVGNWWNEVGGLSRMELRRKIVVLGYCQIELGRERIDGYVFFFLVVNVVFVKLDLFRRFLYGLEV